MRSEVKDAWVAALRSGDYRHGKFQLRDVENHFDAIGVLCEVAIKSGVDIEVKAFTDPARKDPLFWGYTYDGYASWAPPSVKEWAGADFSLNRLAILGDKMGFEKLADHIEKEC